MKPQECGEASKAWPSTPFKRGAKIGQNVVNLHLWHPNARHEPNRMPIFPHKSNGIENFMKHSLPAITRWSQMNWKSQTREFYRSIINRLLSWELSYSFTPVFHSIPLPWEGRNTSKAHAHSECINKCLCIKPTQPLNFPCSGFNGLFVLGRRQSFWWKIFNSFRGGRHFSIS